ncbi:MAG: hypothetical protein DIZ80_12965 [endosymbiont of Galathealinum brachiosum]|uniref:O-antigen ligase-related domain-containing protein n=1 Tax=endosymbiont of Galathealinum brachiosum TaxID=2200906 RepID=A0A370D9R2_9GAMM|nr:MAG: hypothetical protein DIZ80_12965 [endosymbiont of Galathealinum brachiosum]
MIGYLSLLIFLVPLSYFTFTSSKKLVLYVLFIGGIPLTTFMPDLILLGFLGGLAPQAAFLFFIVGALAFIIMFSDGMMLRALFKFKFYALFIIYVLFSLTWSDSFIYGLRFTVKIISPFLLYMAVVGSIKSKKDFQNVEKVLLACVIVVILLAIINFASGGAIGGDKVKYKWIPLGVFTAPYMSPANFSFFISIGAIFSIGNYFYYRQTKYLIVFLVLAAIVFAAFTRISMAGLVFASGICMFILIKNKFVKYVFPLVVVFGFILMLFTVDKFRDRMFYNADEFDFSEAIESPEKFEKNFDTSGRIFLWSKVLEHYEESNGFIGGGVGSLDMLMDKEFKSLELHSEYLRLYLDLGVIGLVLYLLGLLQIILKLLKVSKQNNVSKMYSAIAIGGIGFYLITLFTDNSLNYVTEFGHYVYALIGLAISSSIHLSDEDKEPNNVIEKVETGGQNEKFDSVRLR